MNTNPPAPTRRNTMARPVLAAALHAAARGWPVFPLRPGGKTPAIRAVHEPGHPCRGECGRAGHGFHDATTDPALIEAWWRSWPRANYAISTGAAGLVVIDLDTGKGRPPERVLPGQGARQATPAGILDGADVLTWAAERDGALVGWGETLTVTTPSGGTHLYYTAPAGVQVRGSVGHSGERITGLGWSIDVRAVGGYVVGPGSPGPEGLPPYTAIVKGTVAALPGWLLTRIRAIGTDVTPPVSGSGKGLPCITGDRGWPGPPGGNAGSRYGLAAIRGEVEAIAAATPGGRNNTVNRSAYKLGRILTATGLDDGHVTAHLLAAATGIGLSEREAATAIASGLAQGRANPRTPTDQARPSSAA